LETLGVFSELGAPMTPTLGTNEKRLGALWAIYGIWSIVKVAWVVINATVLSLMWGTTLNRVPNPYPWMSAFHLFLLLAAAVFTLGAVFSLLAASALFTRSRSARNLALAASFFGLISGPLGLALGVYTMILLLPRTGEERYGHLAAAA
jgi:hypothetical protein